MPLAHLKNRTRNDYPYLLDYRTRWADNDMYAHMNNSVYNFLFDSVVNAFLMERTSFNPATRTPQHGLVVHAHTDYFHSISFPAVAELGLRVKRLGASSVHYEVALFQQGQPGVCAVGTFVHVFVDAATGRPRAGGMDLELRAGLQSILVKRAGDVDDEADDEADDGTTNKSKL